MVKDITEVDWDIELVLADPREEVIDAWSTQFVKRPEVKIVLVPTLDVDSDAVICPGNGFGFMDSGFGLTLMESLGWELQDRLREKIAAEHRGELLVGQACVLETGGSPAWLVYAPVSRTGRLPAESVPVFLAARAALVSVREHNERASGERIGRVASPGMGCDDGELEAPISARQFRYGYEQAAGLRGAGGKNLSSLRRREMKLAAMPRSAREEEAEGGAP